MPDRCISTAAHRRSTRADFRRPETKKCNATPPASRCRPSIRGFPVPHAPHRKPTGSRSPWQAVSPPQHCERRPAIIVVSECAGSAKDAYRHSASWFATDKRRPAASHKRRRRRAARPNPRPSRLWPATTRTTRTLDSWHTFPSTASALTGCPYKALTGVERNTSIGKY
jgi:hypothetical protein